MKENGCCVIDPHFVGSVMYVYDMSVNRVYGVYTPHYGHKMCCMFMNGE